MGYYDEGTYGAFDNEYSQQRADARQDLANKLAERESKIQGYMKDQQYQADTTYADDMTKGAQMGAMFGPWGALIGGIAGRATGGIKSFGARRKAGEGTVSAFANSFLNPFETISQLPDAMNSPSAAPLAAQMGKQYKDAMAESSDPTNYASSGRRTDPFGNETDVFRFKEEENTPAYDGAYTVAESEPGTYQDVSDYAAQRGYAWDPEANTYRKVGGI